MSDTRVLIADDDGIIRQMLKHIVEKQFGFSSEPACTAAETLSLATKKPFDLILLDIHFPDCSDLSTLRKIRETVPQTDVIIVTAEIDDLNLVKEATRYGIYDYVPKPLRAEDIAIRVTRVLEMRALRRAHALAIEELAAGRQFTDIVGTSPTMLATIKQATQLANNDFPVLILGETGTGKELIARAIHYASPRRDYPFVAVNCAAIPHTLMESELFGHEKGAFTGAFTKREGAFGRAAKGSLFLDEIGDISPEGQASLLRVLECSDYSPIGGVTRKSEARMILATNKKLESLIKDGTFRQDLFYRIDRLRLMLKPLRERKEDIPLLAKHFLSQIDSKIGRGIRDIPQSILNAFRDYSWPGNVRELRNEIERAYIQSSGDALQATTLSPQILLAPIETVADPTISAKSVGELQQLLDTLRSTDGNISETARILNVHRNTVHRWLHKYSLCDMQIEGNS